MSETLKKFAEGLALGFVVGGLGGWVWGYLVGWRDLQRLWEKAKKLGDRFP